MILKIKAANSQAVESWRFFEGVESLHYSVYDHQPNCANDPLPEGVQRVRYWDDHELSTRFAEVVFMSDVTGPIEITCNTKIFLMNDRGQTIERIL